MGPAGCGKAAAPHVVWDQGGTRAEGKLSSLSSFPSHCFGPGPGLRGEGLRSPQ